MVCLWMGPLLLFCLCLCEVRTMFCHFVLRHAVEQSAREEPACPRLTAHYSARVVQRYSHTLTTQRRIERLPCSHLLEPQAIYAQQYTRIGVQSAWKSST